MGWELVRSLGLHIILIMGPEGTLLEHRPTRNLISWEGEFPIKGAKEGDRYWLDIKVECSTIPAYKIEEYPTGPIVTNKTKTCTRIP